MPDSPSGPGVPAPPGPPAPPAATGPPDRRNQPLQRLLFGGVYGTVLASALISALDNESGPPDPGHDALWVLVAAAASAASHGYAHSIAHHSEKDSTVTAGAVRSVLSEWPIVSAALPTVAALLGSYAGWWGEETAITVALTINTVALFGWGLWAARVSGRGWWSSCRVGMVDVLIGLVIVAVNSLGH